MGRWKCRICGYVYDPVQGDPETVIPPGDPPLRISRPTGPARPAASGRSNSKRCDPREEGRSLRREAFRQGPPPYPGRGRRALAFSAGVWTPTIMIPFSPLLWIYLSAYLLRSGLQACLARLNIAFLRRAGNDVPEPLRDTIDGEKLRKISAYTIESERFGLVASATGRGGLPGPPALRSFSPASRRPSEEPPFGGIGRGLAFMGALSLGLGLARIPFDLYETFVIERRYGFSTTSWRVWVADLVKGTVLSGLLGAIVLGLLLALGAAWRGEGVVVRGVAGRGGFRAPGHVALSRGHRAPLQPV